MSGLKFNGFQRFRENNTQRNHDSICQSVNQMVSTKSVSDFDIITK